MKLDELRELGKAATEGPWIVMDGHKDHIIRDIDRGKKLGGSINPDVEAREFAKTIAHVDGDGYKEFHRSRVLKGPEQDANAAFIAIARNHWDALLDVAEAAIKTHWKPERDEPIKNCTLCNALRRLEEAK